VASQSAHSLPGHVAGLPLSGTRRVPCAAPAQVGHPWAAPSPLVLARSGPYPQVEAMPAATGHTAPGRRAAQQHRARVAPWQRGWGGQALRPLPAWLPAWLRALQCSVASVFSGGCSVERQGGRPVIFTHPSQPSSSPTHHCYPNAQTCNASQACTPPPRLPHGGCGRSGSAARDARRTSGLAARTRAAHTGVRQRSPLGIALWLYTCASLALSLR
jgi:hypothetical protein